MTTGKYSQESPAESKEAANFSEEELLSELAEDLLYLAEVITPEEEADIEACYQELVRRGLITPNPALDEGKNKAALFAD